MKCIKNIEELEGKKIKYGRYVNYDENIAIVFDDGTYIIIVSRTNYDEQEIYLDDDVEDYVLKQAGILSDDEYDKIQEQKKKKQAEETEKRERRRLEYLQEKYKTK